MGRYCDVYDCYNGYKTGHRLHEFPLNHDQRLEWTKFVRMKRPYYTFPRPGAVICEDHFKPECYAVKSGLSPEMGRANVMNVLLPGSVPTIQSDSVIKVVAKKPKIRRKRKRKHQNIMASQMPQLHPENPALHKLPLLNINGMPTTVDKMGQAQLRSLISEMLKYSTGHSKPGWGKRELCPTWWPDDVPWENVRSDIRTDEQKKQVSWTHALRTIVKNCYRHHNRDDLLSGIQYVRSGSGPFFKRHQDDSDDDETRSPCKRRIGTQVLPHEIRAPEDITESELKMVCDSSQGKKYDKIWGTWCHQCRQTTLDTKTICRSETCFGNRGQFCGPCLRKKYTEDARKALKDPNWTCPPCRRICGCSLCRRTNGIMPPKKKLKVKSKKVKRKVLLTTENEPTMTLQTGATSEDNQCNNQSKPHSIDKPETAHVALCSKNEAETVQGSPCFTDKLASVQVLPHSKDKQETVQIAPCAIDKPGIVHVAPCSTNKQGAPCFTNRLGSVQVSSCSLDNARTVQVAQCAIDKSGTVEVAPCSINKPGTVHTTPYSIDKPGTVKVSPYSIDKLGPIQVSPYPIDKPGAADVLPCSTDKPGTLYVLPFPTNNPETIQVSSHFTDKPGTVHVLPYSTNKPGTVQARCQSVQTDQCVYGQLEMLSMITENKKVQQFLSEEKNNLQQRLDTAQVEISALKDRVKILELEAELQQLKSELKAAQKTNAGSVLSSESEPIGSCPTAPQSSQRRQDRLPGSAENQQQKGHSDKPQAVKSAKRKLSREECKKKKAKRILVPRWKEDFPGLEDTSKGMICSICCKHRDLAEQSEFLTGQKNYTLAAVKSHFNTPRHKWCVKVDTMVFVPRWKEDFPGLEDTSEGMICSICCKHRDLADNSSKFVTGEKSYFRGKISTHFLTYKHMVCAKAEQVLMQIQKGQCTGPTEMEG